MEKRKPYNVDTLQESATLTTTQYILVEHLIEIYYSTVGNIDVVYKIFDNHYFWQNILTILYGL